MLTQKTQLLNLTNATATETGEVFELSQSLKGRAVRAAGVLQANADTPGTLTVTIEHSPDSSNSLLWKPLITFIAVTNETGAAGVQHVHVPSATTGVFRYLRAVATIGGGGQFDAIVDFWTEL